MVKKPDGSFMVVDDVELQKLKNENKIGLEYARAMGGKVTDLTQKPIMVLKEWDNDHAIGKTTTTCFKGSLRPKYWLWEYYLIFIQMQQ